LGWISPNAEELKPIAFNKGLEGWMRGETNAMTVLVTQNLGQWYERLDIPTRAHDMYNNIHSWWRKAIVPLCQRRGKGKIVFGGLAAFLLGRTFYRRKHIFG
jgi:hypothetical protein